MRNTADTWLHLTDEIVQNANLGNNEDGNFYILWILNTFCYHIGHLAADEFLPLTIDYRKHHHVALLILKTQDNAHGECESCSSRGAKIQ
jgi:hypothetical protein